MFDIQEQYGFRSQNALFLNVPRNLTKLDFKQKSRTLTLLLGSTGLAACGGGADNGSAEGNVEYEFEDLKLYSLEDFLGENPVSFEELMANAPYGLTATLQQAFSGELDSVELPEGVMFERLELTGVVELSQEQSDIPVASNVHFVAARLSIVDETDPIGENNITVDDYGDGSAELALRTASSVELAAQSSHLRVEGGSKVYIVEGSTLNLTAVDLDVPGDYPFTSVVRIGRESDGHLLISDAGSFLGITGHRPQLRIGSEGDVYSTMTVANGASLVLQTVDFGPEISSAPTALLQVGYQYQSANPVRGELTIKDTGSNVELIGGNAYVDVGNSNIGRLTVKDGAVLMVDSSAATVGGQASISIGTNWDGYAAGTGSAVVSGAGTKINVIGNEASMTVGRHADSTASLQISDGAKVSISAVRNDLLQTSYADAFAFVGSYGGTGSMTLAGAGSELLISGSEGAFLNVARGSNDQNAVGFAEGHVNIMSGAALRIHNSYDFDVASYPENPELFSWLAVGRWNGNGNASMNVDGKGTIVELSGFSNYLAIGVRNSTGSMEISNAASVVLDYEVNVGADLLQNILHGVAYITIGSNPNELDAGASTLRINGADSNLRGYALELVLEVNSTGSVDVSDGGSIFLTTSETLFDNTTSVDGVLVSGRNAVLSMDEGQLTSTVIEINSNAELIGAGSIIAVGGLTISDSELKVGDYFENDANALSGVGTLDVVGNVTITATSLYLDATDSENDLLNVDGFLSISGGTITFNGGPGTYTVATATDGISWDETTTLEGATGEISIVELAGGGQALQILVPELF